MVTLCLGRLLYPLEAPLVLCLRLSMCFSTHLSMQSTESVLGNLNTDTLQTLFILTVLVTFSLLRSV